MLDLEVQCIEFSIGDLVEYSDNMPFALPFMKLGLVIEKIDIKYSIEDIQKSLDAEHKGFMKEWANYLNLKEALEIPSLASENIEARERILNRVIAPDNITTKYLYKVLWNNGVQYIEHPEDIILFTEKEE